MSEDVHLVRRTPPMVGGTAPLPLEPEPREHIEITLVGGPHHGQAFKVWTEVRHLKIPVAQSTEAPADSAAEVKEVDDGQGGKVTVVNTKRALVESTAVFAVYTRESTDATTAVFSDFRLED